MKNKNIIILFFLLLCSISIFSSCKIFISGTTCHTCHFYCPENVKILKEYSVLTEKKRKTSNFEGQTQTILNKGQKYVLFSNHCRTNLIKIELLEKTEDGKEKVICMIDCSQNPKNSTEFQVEKSDVYYFRVTAHEKMYVYFCIGQKN